ncbi:MAG: hypothetical protein IJ728_14605 [Selenomonadaceae bacterium]|nr:hypothetical protein [Selenomonadaceae bacterium]MBR1730743.1 hypothetical protein [Selenomonadaceae bacterium]
MTLEEGLNVLHLDAGINDELVQSLLNAIPNYIEVTTGMDIEQQAEEPMIKIVSGFLLQLWYFSDKADDVSLNRTIDSLLKAITLKVKK